MTGPAFRECRCPEVLGRVAVVGTLVVGCPLGATINDNGNNSANGNAPLGFNNFADGIVLNQAWLYLAKETQTNGYGFDWGFRTDFLFGADAP